MALARRLGLESGLVVEALRGSSIVSPWQQAKLERIADGDYSPQFALSLALKDVRLALQATDDNQLAALGCLADEWQRAVDGGLGDQDLTVMARALVQPHGATR
jgi:3-hydroxyisobutyrate dehydrogenase